MNEAEFVRYLVDQANRNQTVMDGTMAPVRRIVAGAELVLAVWQDQAQDHGVDLLPIKGAKLLSEIVASGTAQNIRTNAILCTCAEQAVALKQVLGDRDHDA